jgi:flagellar biosynthesis/type III secretory pathway chaperone
MKTQTCTELGSAEAQVLAAQIREEAAAQRELLDSLRAKEALLVKQDIAALEGWIAGSDAVLRRLEGIGQRRSKIVAQLGRRLGIGERPRLRELAAAATADVREPLAAACAELAELARQVARQNQRNSLLARESIVLNEEILRRLFVVPEGSPTYTPAGSRQGASTGGILDRKL